MLSQDKLWLNLSLANLLLTMGVWGCHEAPTRTMLTCFSILKDLGALYIRAHLELSPLGFEVGLNFSPTLQSGPLSGPCNIKSIGPLVGPKLEILL